MGVVERKSPNIARTVLISEFGDEVADFLLKERYLINGRTLETYWPGGVGKEVNIEWNEKLKSFTYLSGYGELISIKNDHLKTYDANIDKIVSFLAEEFDVLESSKTKRNHHLEELLYFVGNAQISKKKVAIFLARRLREGAVFKKIDEFFLTQSTTRLKKLILTSSRNVYPETTKTGASIISIPKLLKMANSNKLFNLDYVANVVFNKNNENPKPYIHCTEDGGILFIGEESWNVGGSKKRQIIKLMCDHYAADPKKKLKWDELLIEADIDESTTSRFRDMFKDSKIKELIANKDGYVWFIDR